MARARLWQLAAAASIVAVLLSIVLRPLWRDEYWTLYFAGGDVSLYEALFVRARHDVHPPLTYAPLHYVDALFRSDLAARALNLVYLAGGFALAWAVGRDRRDETRLYLFLAVTAFWATYFAVEIRNYALLYALIAPAVVVMRRALEGDIAKLGVWLLLAMAASATHYYGALWTGVTGGAAALTMLAARRPRDFFLWGFATALAVAPTAAWVLLRDLGQSVALAAPDAAQSTPADRLSDGAEQFLRGLLVKTFGANLPAAIAAFMAAGALTRLRDRNDGVLAASVLGVTALAFLVQGLVAPVIKERSFIVIIPPLLYLAARALAVAETKGGAAAWWARWAPAAALAAPLLFAPEHFKDREELDQVRALLARSGACADAPVLAYLRPFEQAPGFSAYMSERALAATRGGPPRLIDAAAVGEGDIARIEASACPVKGLALGLLRGKRDREIHRQARAALAEAGLPIDSLTEVRLGEGRTLAYVDD